MNKFDVACYACTCSPCSRKSILATLLVKLTGCCTSDLIDAFNAAYSVEEILVNAGYKQRGDTFCHQNSSSGSYAATVRNGRVNSLNGTDPLNAGSGAHDAFSAFCVLNHDGDKNSALIDAGDQWLKIEGESWNKLKQREYMRNKADAQKTAKLTVNTSSDNGFKADSDKINHQSKTKKISLST